MPVSLDDFEVCDKIPSDLKNVVERFYVLDNRKGYNVLFVTIDDIVFGFGTNSYGVCGVGNEMVVNEPKVIEELCGKSVKQFFNGFAFALALTSDGQVWGWGRYDHGQLGLDVINL